MTHTIKLIYFKHEEFVLMFPDRFEPEEVERAKAEIGRKMK